MIYGFIFIAILYSVYKYDLKNNTGYRNTVYWGLCILFILIAGLRYRIGGDTLGYMNSWKLYPNFWDFNWLADIEKCKETYPDMERYQTGWFLFVMFLLGIWKDHITIQFTISILINIAIFKTVKKYSKYPFITIFIYFFNFKFLELEFEVLRESVAISIFLLISFDNYVKRKWLKYYIGTILSYLVHPSAVFMFILPFFRNLNLSLFKNTLIFVIPPIVIAIVGRIILGNFLLAFLNQDADSTSYVMKAVDREYNSNYILMYMFQPLILYALVASCYKKIKNTIYSPLFFFAAFFLFLSLLYFTSSRLVNYIIIPVYVGITPIMYHWIKKFQSILVLPLFLLIFNFSTLLEFRKTPEKKALYFPYQNVIFPDRSPLQKNIDRFSISD